MSESTKLTSILDSIRLDPADKDKLGEYVADFVRHSLRDFDTPEDDYKLLRAYVRDAIMFTKQELEFTSKYSPAIYHHNVPLSRNYWITIWQYILDKLDEH